MSNAPNTPRYPAYKPTNIPWCPEIPEAWEVRRLKYLTTNVRKGSGITKEEVDESGDTPCIRYGEIYSIYDYFCKSCASRTSKHKLTTLQWVNNGDLLFACTGELVDEIGKNIVYLGSEPCLAGGDIVIVSHNQEPCYLNYCLGSSFAQQQKSFGKAKLKVVHISAREILGIRLPLPPLPTQRAIVAYLDEKCGKIDRLVAAKEREGALLRELKQAVIAEAVTRGVPCKKRRHFVPSNIPWLPEVPEGWEVKRLKYLLFQKFEISQLGKKVGLENIESYSGKYIPTASSFAGCGVAFEPGDILYGKLRPYLAKAWLAEFAGNAVGDFYVYSPSEAIEARYALYCLLSKPFTDICTASTYGAKMPRVSSHFINSLSLPLPPLSEQREIVAYLDARCGKLDAAVGKLEAEVAALKEYKQRLIADVVTGQRKVV